MPLLICKRRNSQAKPNCGVFECYSSTNPLQPRKVQVTATKCWAKCSETIRHSHLHTRENPPMSHQTWFAKPLISIMLLTGGLLISPVSHAQFLSAPQVLRDSQFDYKTLAPASSTPTFLTQANAEGASRFAFVGDNAFGDPLNPTIVAIYGRALSLPTSYLYQTVPTTNSTGCARLSLFWRSNLRGRDRLGTGERKYQRHLPVQNARTGN
jgi:hypothetical protein